MIGGNVFAEADAAVSMPTGTTSSLPTMTYGPPAAAAAGPFSPRHGHGLGFWLSVAGVGVLVLIRQSLPR